VSAEILRDALSALDELRERDGIDRGWSYDNDCRIGAAARKQPNKLLKR